MITCPNCGECLRTKKKYLWVIGAVSVLAAVYATGGRIYKEPGYMFVTEVLVAVLFFVLSFCFVQLVPPKRKRIQGKAFDERLSLFGTEKSGGDKKHPRR
jgi:hypothetical protein